MRYGPNLERNLRAAILLNPEDHILLPDEMYRPDNTVMTYRDNRQQMVHRRLWELVNDRVLERREYLLRTCDRVRCVNPHHYTLSRTPHPGQKLDTCPNGHKYTSANTLPRSMRDRCKQCREDRLARRRLADAERRRTARKDRNG